jgi:rhodanese-related sulfurtransferase
MNKVTTMKFFLDNWLLIAVALSSGGMLMMPALQKAGQGALTADDAVRLINRERAVVVDVCQPPEYAAGHIVGAKNIPLDQLENKLTHTVKNKTVPLILVCQSGGRSNRAVDMAKKLGYAQALSLSGGLNAWRSANLPVERA